MIGEEAIEAAAEWLPHSDDCEVRPERDCTCWHPRLALMRAALEAAAPHMLRELLALADDRDKEHGAIRGHITTYELRQALKP